MIHGFPIPYPDELFYSLVARRAARLRYPTNRAALREVFGTESVAGTLEFPCRLRWLQQELPDKHPCANESLLSNNTLLPWYAPFMPAERVVQLKQHMLYGTSAPIFVQRGVPHPLFLRFCPECFREDKIAGRELYWRRLHQLTGIEVCPNHEVHLEASQVARRETGYWGRFEIPPETLLEVPSRKVEAAVLVRMGKLGEDLLSGALRSVGQAQLRAAYRNALTTTGFLSPNGLIRLQDLAHRLSESFPEDYLARANCSIHKRPSIPWFTALLRQSSSTSAPLKHLLLICAFDLKLADLAVAQGFELCQSKLESKLFNNPVCPKREELALPRQGPRTVTNQGMKKEMKKVPLEAEWRKCWLRAIEEHPSYGVTRLRKALPKVYGRLSERDRAWLQKHSPREQNPRRRKSRVNWDERDIRLSRAIFPGAFKVRQTIPLIRVTLLAICRVEGIPYKLIHKQLDRMPRCLAALAETVETQIDFACRRIIMTAKECVSTGVALSFWQLFRLTCFNFRILRNPKIQEAMREAQILMGNHSLRRQG